MLAVVTDLFEGLNTGLYRHRLVQDHDCYLLLVRKGTNIGLIFKFINRFLPIVDIMDVVSQADVFERDAQGLHIVVRIIGADDN